ncbi:hypothetical protein TRVA0_022S02102 [Trichomonascus vanleenenianus]|uniref:uncharacterized protein n=1 Tax=Trichomonascus vanleenenianus TaxID=2268995 RepID=UPI003EC9E174
MTSLADTYYLASRARYKLTREASRQDHDLRVLVSHANMLDNLMDSLHKQRAEQQEMLKKRRAEQMNRRVSFDLPAKPTLEVTAAAPAEAIEEDDDNKEVVDYYSDSSDSESDSDGDDYEEEESEDEEYLQFSSLARRQTHPHRTLPTIDEDYEEMVAEEEEINKSNSKLASSRRPPSPPAEDDLDSKAVPSLSYSSEEESEDEIESVPRLINTSTARSLEKEGGIQMPLPTIGVY